MATYHDPETASKPYKEPAPLPEHIPKIQELGTTSAPLKSAAFFIGAHCKEYNGEFGRTFYDVPTTSCWLGPSQFNTIREGTVAL